MASPGEGRRGGREADSALEWCCSVGSHTFVVMVKARGKGGGGGERRRERGNEQQQQQQQQ